EYSYTAATVTTRRFFSYGRWEFRVALPIGKQIRTSIFTRNDNESYWHEFGQINILANTGEAVIYRGVHFANSSGNYQPSDHILSVPLEQMNAFHLYGIEWSESGVQFFLGESYSKMIYFDTGKNCNLNKYYCLTIDFISIERHVSLSQYTPSNWRWWSTV